MDFDLIGAALAAIVGAVLLALGYVAGWREALNRCRLENEARIRRRRRSRPRAAPPPPPPADEA